MDKTLEELEQEQEQYESRVFIGKVYELPIRKQDQEIPKDQLQQELKVNNNKFTVLTYNVWFGEHNFDLRVAEIFKLILKYNADFVCLQEVTQNFVIRFFQNSQINSVYAITQSNIIPYGCVILSKHAFKVTESIMYSEMQRNLLELQVQINGIPFIISTMHLESCSYSQNIRLKQIEAIKQKSEDHENYIFMGDTNYGSDTKEEQMMEEQFKEVWKVLKDYKNDPGLTRKQRRLDKVYYKSQKIQPLSIEIFGKEPIPKYQTQQNQSCKNYEKMMGEMEVRTPSDHFGVYVEFQLIN